jgi:hypothetical protein
MPKYVIEREIPNAGKLSPAELEAISQNFLWRPRRVAKIVRQLVEKSLHASRRLQRPELSQLRAR